MNVSLEDAYANACRQLGEAHVQIDLMAAELDRVTAERDEAGRRVVELLAAPREHAGTIDDPDPTPPMGETRVQNCCAGGDQT